MFSVTAFAADGTKTMITGEENVSYLALNRFRADFRSAKEPAWTVTSNCQKVSFILDDVKMTAFYNLSGDYLGTTQDIDYKALPADAKKEIAAKYSSYTVGEVIKYENFNSDTEVSSPAYFVDLKKDKGEILLKVMPDGGVSFFKKIK